MLKNACRELGFEIDIDYFTIDMEVGMVKAIKTEFPEHSDIRFCSFHVGRSGLEEKIRRPWLKEICNEQEN